MSQTFKINNSVLILQTLVVSGWVLSIDIYIISRLGIMFFVYVILRFLQNLGRELPMRELTLMIMLLQLLICPILVYHYFDNDVIYPMDIAEIPYVNYVFLAISLFALGLFIPLNLGELKTVVLIRNLKAKTKSNGKFGMILILAGFASTFLLKFSPSSLAFVFYLLVNFKFVGAFLILFSNNKYKYFWLVLVFGLYTLDIVGGGLFINLFVWALMLLIIVLIKIEVSYLYKVLLLVAGFAIVFFVNGFKSEYREVTWRQNRSISERPRSNQEVFLDIAFERAEEMTLEGSEKDDVQYDNFNDFVSRLNQGWIVAKVMNHVPLYEPYTGGETIVADIKNAIIPRVIYQNKAKAGGQEGAEKFMKFTGKTLGAGTRMTIGTLGDAYVNFGYLWGSVFMFGFGLFINLILVVLAKFAERYPSLILWIPFIMFYTMRAGNEFAVILNFLTKSLVIVVLVYKFFGEKLKEEYQAS